MPYLVHLKSMRAPNGMFINPRAPGVRMMLNNPLAFRLRDGGFPANMGDPGFFSAIGKALKGAAKFATGVVQLGAGLSPAGLILKAGQAVVSRIGAPASRSGSAPIYAQPQAMLPPSSGANPFAQMGFGGGTGPGPGMGGGGDVTGGDVNVSTAGSPGTAVARCAPAGYHLNKSAYWKNQSAMLPGASRVEKGTILVKNRRQNPFNPRAASRAMARLANLYRGMKVLDKQMRKVARSAGVKAHHQAPKRRKAS